MMEHMDPEADAYEGGFEMVPRAVLNAEAETRLTAKRIFYAMLLAAFLLLTFNSEALVTYVRGLPIGMVEDTIIAVTEAWNAQMEKNGITELHDMLHRAFEDVHNATWDDVDRLLSGEGFDASETLEEMRPGVSG